MILQPTDLVDPKDAHTIPKVDRTGEPPEYLVRMSQIYWGSESAWQEPWIEAAIQLHIIRNRWYWAHWEDSGLRTDSPIHHWLRAYTAVWPEDDQHEWLRHMLWTMTLFGAHVKGFGRVQLANFDGAANSAKTQVCAKGPLLFLLSDPAYWRIYLGQGRKQGAEEGVWPRISDAFQDCVNRGIRINLAEGVSTLKPAELTPLRHDQLKDSLGEVKLVPNLSEAGYVKLMAYDQVANLKGRKPRKPGQVDRGGLMIVIDEASYFLPTPAHNIDKALRNILRQKKAFCLAAQNPEEPSDLGGTIAQPLGKEYEDFSIDLDHWWRISYYGAKGYSWRYDAHYSPNFRLGIDRYVYLPCIEDLKGLREEGEGERSAVYRVEARAWRLLGENDRAVLAWNDCRAGRLFEEDTLFSARKPELYGFSDTSLGGDKWTLLIAEVKEAMGEDGVSNGLVAVPSGEAHPDAQILEAPLDPTLILDEAWIHRINAVTKVFSREGLLVPGEPVPVEIQGAVWTAEMLSKFDVNRKNFGYDFSMRAKITRAMDACIGLSHCWEYSDPAPEKPIPWKKDAKAKELYYNFRSFTYFLLADLVRKGRWRSEGVLKTAARQVSRHHKLPGDGKERVESKDEYKANNKQRSPDEADTWAGLNCVIWLNGGFGPVSQGSRMREGSDVWSFLKNLGGVNLGLGGGRN